MGIGAAVLIFHFSGAMLDTDGKLQGCVRFVKIFKTTLFSPVFSRIFGDFRDDDERYLI